MGKQLRLAAMAVALAGGVAGCDPGFGVQGTIELGDSVEPTGYTKLRIQAGSRGDREVFDVLFHDEKYELRDGRVVTDDLEYVRPFPFEYNVGQMGYSERPQWRVRAWLSTLDAAAPDGSDPRAQEDFELGRCTFYMQPSWCGSPVVDLILLTPL
jgi:hypothetical protein